jgi:hypothetical protein
VLDFFFAAVFFEADFFLVPAEDAFEVAVERLADLRAPVRVLLLVVAIWSSLLPISDA